jgi:hypothetical protein
VLDKTLDYLFFSVAIGVRLERMGQYFGLAMAALVVKLRAAEKRRTGDG